jgi:hypothetical protein
MKLDLQVGTEKIEGRNGAEDRRRSFAETETKTQKRSEDGLLCGEEAPFIGFLKPEFENFPASFLSGGSDGARASPSI